MRNLLVATLCAFSLDTLAVSVSPNPLLPDGIRLDYFGLGWQSTTLTDAERPSGLVGPVGVVHLGTNSDVFKSSSNEYWVRYTLDSTSHSTYEYFPDPEHSEINTSLSGELWVSFKPITGGYDVDVYVDQIDQRKGCVVCSYRADGGAFNANRYSSTNRRTWQSFPTGSLFFQEFTGEGGTSLNLSFLRLEWDGGKYELKTSITGFDQVFYEWASEGAYGTASLNIAPVPVPAAGVLLLSGLAGLIGAGRFRKSVI